VIIPVIITVYADRSFSFEHEDAAGARAAAQEGRWLHTEKKKGSGAIPNGQVKWSGR
jgi:ribosomal protein L11